jgi:hypothetical protein
VGTFRAALDAQCQITVNGVGTIDMENDYLPNVVNCENGGASFEALKVQAVSARTFAYYKIETSGSVNDGTGDQVYSCGRQPSQQHFDAVNQTSGQVLTYNNDVIAAFFVAGAHQTGPGCQGGTDDPTNTERFVTYNEGLSGNNIHQTTLGFVSPTNYRNRGCMSQNGSDCLAQNAYTYDRALRFYYGEDIGLEQTTGACVVPPPPGPDAGPPPVDMSSVMPPPPGDDAGVPADTAAPPQDATTGAPPSDMTGDGRPRINYHRGPDGGNGDFGSQPPPPPALQTDGSVGGCAVLRGEQRALDAAPLLAALALLLAARPRRR